MAVAGEPLNVRVALASAAILGAIVLIRRGERSIQVEAARPMPKKIPARQECA